MPTRRSTGNVIQLLNGFLIAPCGNCLIPSRLHTEYRSWRIGVNAATDFAVGRTTLTPSVEILGGQSSTRQTYAQQRVVVGGPTAFYDAATNMKWEDAGAKLGLAVSVPITPMIDFGIGGTLAVVYRNATLNGSDRSR